MLRSLLERCGLLIGPIQPDPELELSASQVRDVLYEWKEQMERHAAEDAQLRPHKPMRRVK